MKAEESNYSLINGFLEDVPRHKWLALKSKKQLFDFSELSELQQKEARQIARRKNQLAKRVDEVIQ